MQLKGNLFLTNDKPYNFSGEFNNISVNRIFQQTGSEIWDRFNIKISSNEFNIKGSARNKKDALNSLKGTANINGSLYFQSTNEERFGAALLSLLVEKVPSISSISNSINYIIVNYGDIPTSLKGKFTIDNGLIKTEKFSIENEHNKSEMNASLNLANNKIDGNIIFYKDEEIFIESFIDGSLQNPEILVDGKIFNKNSNEKKNDIRKIFQDGINSLVDELLKIDD